LKNAGFRIQNVASDGNCLFRAVALQFYGTDRLELHAALREAVCDHMVSIFPPPDVGVTSYGVRCVRFQVKYKDYYEPFVTDPVMAFDEYIAAMRRDQCWGGDPEIQVLARRFL
jgi:hypothetical protein